MPLVRIEMLAGRSADLKQELASEITSLIARLCRSDPAHVWVIFDDVQPRDWAVAGRTFDAPAPAAAQPGQA